jgi:hypothetical protein
MKAITRLFVLLAGVAAFGILGAGQSFAFSSSDLNGSYSVKAAGVKTWIESGGSPLKLDVSWVGVANYDGNGNVAGSIVETIGGASESFPQVNCIGTTSGTYSVNPDGTGTEVVNLTITSGAATCTGGSFTQQIVISKGGKTIDKVTTASSATSEIGVITETKQHK